MAIDEHERIGREAPADDDPADGEAHREKAVDAIRALARKHDEEKRELGELDRALGVESAKTPQHEAVHFLNALPAIPVDASKIRPAMRVVSAEDDPVAVIDHVDGTATIKLAKDAAGVHHYIPLGWVARVDDQVHLDRSREQAMRDWTTAAPAR